MKCFHKNCEQKAAGGISLNIPAKGMPIPEHDPIKLVLSLELCEDHIKSATPDRFISDDLKKIIEITAKGRNLAEPDYARAFIKKVEFGSKEWVILRRGRG